MSFTSSAAVSASPIIAGHAMNIIKKKDFDDALNEMINKLIKIAES